MIDGHGEEIHVRQCSLNVSARLKIRRQNENGLILGLLSTALTNRIRFTQAVVTAVAMGRANSLLERGGHDVPVVSWKGRFGAEYTGSKLCSRLAQTKEKLPIKMLEVSSMTSTQPPFDHEG